MSDDYVRVIGVSAQDGTNQRPVVIHRAVSGSFERFIAILMTALATALALLPIVAGGNRPGPILQILHNVFDGASDYHLDLDSTDAWIEGNIFLHSHKNGNTPDSSAAVSGGDNGGNG